MKIRIKEVYKWWICFIILIILALAGISHCTAQTIGMNGAGFFENRTEQSDQWLLDETGDNVWVLRLPGGAITKYANPTPYRGGWGMDSTIVDSITFLYKSKEEEQSDDILEKWYRKTANQPMTSYLYDLIDLNEKFNLEVIWAANIYIPASEAIIPIEFLLMNGVNVVAVEMGNESYSQVKHDFNEYVVKSSPIAEMVRALGIPVIHPAAPFGNRTRKDHEQWNQSLCDFIQEGDGVVFHPYFDGREFPALFDGVDTSLAYEQIDNFDFDGFYNEFLELFPDAEYYLVTETNSQPSRLIGNTDLNAYLMNKVLSEGAKYLDWICIHNGVSPDVYGLIFGIGEQHQNTTLPIWGELVRSSNCVEVEKDRPECERCKRIMHKFFNWRKCTDCRNNPTFTEINCN